MLIVVAAHGCGIGGLGPYGNEWIATPNLDRLAADAEVYDRHFSACPDPVVTRRAWWANLPPGSILIRNVRPEQSAPADVSAAFAEVIDARPDALAPSPVDALLRALPAVLDRNPPLVWIETDRLLPPWAVPQAVFEVYLEELTGDVASDDEDEERIEEDEVEGDEAEDDEAEAEPVAEVEEPVTPWANPETGWFDPTDLAAWELLHRTYAAVVTAFDADLGRVFDLLRERGLDAAATWAVTGDFGFPLGQHGLLGPHRPYLHDEFVHLPLIVRRPGAATAGTRVARFTQPEDVLRLLLGEAIPDRPSVLTRWAVNGAEEAALRTERHALLLPLTVPDEDDPRGPMLFEKPDDRWEVNDVRQADLDRADELEAELRARLTPGPSS